MGTKHIIKNRNDIENEKRIRFSTKDRQYMVIILVVAELILDRYQIFFYFKKKLNWEDLKLMSDRKIPKYLNEIFNIWMNFIKKFYFLNIFIFNYAKIE